MIKIWLIVTAALLAIPFSPVFAGSFYEIKATTADSQSLDFSSYRGKVVLVVNTASGCGYTPQLAGLQQLNVKYEKQGFSVLAVPSDDFKQEGLSNAEIPAFMKDKYGATFATLGKASVNGSARHPLYQFLMDQGKGKPEIAWNFEKFLIDRKGQVVGRYDSSVTPFDSRLIADIEAALKI